MRIRTRPLAAVALGLVCLGLSCSGPDPLHIPPRDIRIAAQTPDRMVNPGARCTLTKHPDGSFDILARFYDHLYDVSIAVWGAHGLGRFEARQGTRAVAQADNHPSAAITTHWRSINGYLTLEEAAGGILDGTVDSYLAPVPPLGLARGGVHLTGPWGCRYTLNA